MNNNLAIQLIIRSLNFFAIAFPLFCCLETLIIVGYMNIANNFKLVFKTTLITNAITSILSIFLIVLADIVLFYVSQKIARYYGSTGFLPYYRLFVVVCIYSLTVLTEWMCMRKLLARLKLSPRKLLTSSCIANQGKLILIKLDKRIMDVKNSIGN